MVAIPSLTPERLGQMTEAIVQAVAPERIVLFGSRAKGTARPDSDVDLLIVTAGSFGPHRSRRKEAAKIWQSLAKFGMPTDILLYSQQEVDAWQGSRNHITTRALQEGRVLYKQWKD